MGDFPHFPRPPERPRLSREGEPGWVWRRSIVFPVVIFACWRLMAMEGAADTRVNDTIAFGWISLIAVLVLGYAGFATVQDVAAIWATRSGLPYAPTSSPATPAVVAADGATTVVVAGPAPTEPGSAPG